MWVSSLLWFLIAYTACFMNWPWMYILVDGWLTIWKELGAETVAVFVEELEKVILVVGLVEEIMIYNSMIFCLKILQIIIGKWNIKKYFRPVLKLMA